MSIPYKSIPLCSAPALFAQDGGGGLEMLSSFFPFIIIGVLFYLILLRPQRKKQQEMNQMLTNLKKNDRVVTIGGIKGVVMNVSKDADEVTLRIDETTNTKIQVLRSSIARIIDRGDDKGAEPSSDKSLAKTDV